MDHHVVAFGRDQAGPVAKLGRCGTDKVEQPLLPRRDMGAVLDVARRPEPRRRRVVAPVEQGVEGFEHERLVGLRCDADHQNFPLA